MQERASGRRAGTRQVSASDMVQSQGAHLKELPANMFLRSPANMRAPLRLFLMLIETLVTHRPDPPQTSACESGANRPPNSMAGQLSAINKPPLGRVGAAPDEKQQQPPGPSYRFKFQYGDQVIPRPGRRRNSPAWLLLERTRQDWINFKMKQKTSPPRCASWRLDDLVVFLSAHMAPRFGLWLH